jgi:hypothetical protein
MEFGMKGQRAKGRGQRAERYECGSGNAEWKKTECGSRNAECGMEEQMTDDRMRKWECGMRNEREEGR